MFSVGLTNPIAKKCVRNRSSCLRYGIIWSVHRDRIAYAVLPSTSFSHMFLPYCFPPTIQRTSACISRWKQLTQWRGNKIQNPFFLSLNHFSHSKLFFSHLTTLQSHKGLRGIKTNKILYNVKWHQNAKISPHWKIKLYNCSLALISFCISKGDMRPIKRKTPVLWRPLSAVQWYSSTALLEEKVSLNLHNKCFTYIFHIMPPKCTRDLKISKSLYH